VQLSHAKLRHLKAAMAVIHTYNKACLVSEFRSIHPVLGGVIALFLLSHNSVQHLVGQHHLFSLSLFTLTFELVGHQKSSRHGQHRNEPKVASKLLFFLLAEADAE